MIMNNEIMITQQYLIDWLDRPPSNDDIDLINFIVCRLDNFYKLKEENKRLNNIINELDKWLKEQKNFIEEMNYIQTIKEIKMEHKIMINDYNNVLDKLKELKEGKNNERR